MGYCAHEALGEVSLGALGQASPEKDIEELRLRLVQEAEENFKREAKKLCGEDGEVVSYHTASSGREGGVQIAATTTTTTTTAAMSPPPGFGSVTAAGWSLNITPTEWRWAGLNLGWSCSAWWTVVDEGQRTIEVFAAVATSSTPVPRGSGGAGAGAMGSSGLPMRPPGLGSQDQQGLQADPEALKSALVGDISNSAREWWSQVLNETMALYDRCLISTPLERIRLQHQKR